MKLLTPKDVAARTQLCEATIRRLCQRGEIHALKPAGQWRITEEALAAYLAGSAPRPPLAPVPDGTVGSSPSFARRLQAIKTTESGGDAA